MDPPIMGALILTHTLICMYLESVVMLSLSLANIVIFQVSLMVLINYRKYQWQMQSLHMIVLSHTNVIYMLIARNIQHVLTIALNLITPFILRQATGIILKDVPKIHCQDPTKEDHCILHHEIGLSIKLILDGVFSIFDTRAPTVEDFCFVQV